MIFLQLFVLVLLLGFTAYFSLVEAAITTLSALRMKKIVLLSPRLAPLFQDWLAKPHRLLSVLMVGNNVVSIGFNQPFDSPTAMRAFAAQQRIDYPNWHFLSPPPAQVAALARSFGFSYQATPAGFDHVLGVTVVDAEGRIHAQVYGDRLNAAALGEPLRKLLRAAPIAQERRLEDLIERVRILCTVYDPEIGAYRYDYKLIFEIAGGLTFFVTVGVYLVSDRLRRRRTMAGMHVAAT